MLFNERGDEVRKRRRQLYDQRMAGGGPVAGEKLNFRGDREIVAQGLEMNYEYERLCRCLKSIDSNSNVQFQSRELMATWRRSLDGGRTWDWDEKLSRGCG
jgi:hypothetical protein